ncbi:MAG: ABC transporter substrate-binding protein [Actinobacteria bacterium]|nr:ABC transporter substrate-binding protein [Actinomycetota bacterium]
MAGALAAGPGGGGGDGGGGGGAETGAGGESGGTITLGYVGDFSDIYSFYDIPIREGAEFAIDEINGDGGVLGKQLELVAIDGKNDQEQSIRAAEELISDRGVAYLIGTTSDPFIAIGTLACQEGIPVSTGDSTAPTLVQDIGECAYQIVMSDNVQGGVAGEWAAKQGYETAFLLGSSEIPYTDNLPGYFAEAFENAGGEVLGREEFRIDAGDYSPQVTKIANMNPKPDVIFTPMFIPDTPVFMRQLRAAGVDIPVISTDGNHDPSLLKAGNAVEGMVFTTHALPEAGGELGEFFDRFEQETGKPPASVVTAVGYDEIQFLKAALESAGSADPEPLKEALASTSIEGVSGSIEMNADTRRAEKPVTLVEVKDGEFALVDQFFPEFVPEP